MDKFNYRFSFIPKEIPMSKWCEYADQECKMELYTDDMPIAIQEQLSLPDYIKVGRLIRNTVKNTIEPIIHIKYELIPKSVDIYTISGKVDLNHLEKPSADDLWDFRRKK